MTNQAVTIATTVTADANRRWQWFQRGWAVAVLSLMVATWRLWIPITDFPQVPMVDLPFFLVKFDLVAVITSFLALGSIATSRQPPRLAFVVLLLSLLVTFIANQHRLQPWAYQAALHCLAFATLSPRSARHWIIALSISIYFYSACGKFDYQFLHTVGQDFIAGVFGPADGVPSRLRLLFAGCLPVTELAIAIGLCFSRTRRTAGVAAMWFHVGLIIMLGPWFLGHSSGVLLWNIWLMILAWEIFVVVCPKPLDPSEENEPANHMAVKLVLLAALLLPLVERTGYWDHWLSWSLYSPHTSRVEIELHESVLASLPESAKPFVDRDQDGDGWHTIAIDRWSLATVGVPIYPQARFQLGVARSLARSITAQDAIRLKLRSASDRWTGARVERWLYNSSEIESASKDFWLLGIFVSDR